ncbi:hypothetical protein RvY_00899 [Ramazzottius varieornatus]|uniref:Uncharacterized protein n=1 Tax=Ramazzottius varieornatus TaxID=947166 RepID=A0A1D1UFB2_RAMVA|nr:hypothetical protein RvY_00899 [Ramazzottius varieornatus]
MDQAPARLFRNQEQNCGGVKTAGNETAVPPEIFTNKFKKSMFCKKRHAQLNLGSVKQKP